MAIIQLHLKTLRFINAYEINDTLHWKYKFFNLDNKIKSWDELDKLR